MKTKILRSDPKVREREREREREPSILLIMVFFHLREMESVAKSVSCVVCFDESCIKSGVIL